MCTLVIDSSVAVDVSSSNHVFDLVVRQRFTEVRHHVTQLSLADKPSQQATHTVSSSSKSKSKVRLYYSAL